MKIAILGTRGIPNHYGGFEQYAELLSTYLAEQGWEVTVYNSHDHPYQQDTYKSVRIKHIYDPEKKLGTIGQFIYDLGCIWDSRKQKFDMVYQLGYTSSAVFNFLFPRKTTIVTNMDGLEWKRSKYNRYVQHFLKWSERLVVKSSHYLVADSLGIKDYLDKKYNTDTFYSAYTAVVPEKYDVGLLSSYGLSPGDYNLLIARLEPENNIETIIEGHILNGCSFPLIIIGNHNTKYGAYLKNKYKNDHIKFVGAIYEKFVIDSIRHFSRMYFHGHSVGGTNPSLLEAMACECNIVAHNNIFNKSVLGQEAWYFDTPLSINQSILSFNQNSFLFDNWQKTNLEKIKTIFSENYVFSSLKEKLIDWQNAQVL